MPDNIPDWAVPDWAQPTVPDWAQPSAVTLSHKIAPDPNLVSTTAGGAPLELAGAPDWQDIKEAAHELNEDTARPAVALPKFTVNPDDSKTAAVLKTAANQLISLPEFAESPQGVAALATGAFLPRTVAGAFLAQTAGNVADQAKQLGASWDDLTPAQKAAGVTELAGQTALAGALAHGAGGGLADAIDTRVNPAGMLARELDQTPPDWAKGAPAEATPQTEFVPDWARPQTGIPPKPEETAPPAAAIVPETAATVPPEAETVSPANQDGGGRQSAATEETANAPESPDSSKLIPVDVTDAQIKAMRTDAQERPPDVLDDIEAVTSKPVLFEADHADTITNAREQTLTKSGRPSAETGRLDARASTDDGEPADRVLQGLAAANPRYADWTPDDLANAIVAAHTAREAEPNDAGARALAEQAARDQLFAKANKASRPGAESWPVEELVPGATFTHNGQPMRVAGVAVDAETGQPSHVEFDGAYGRQTLPMGSEIHIDEGSLKGSDINSGALGRMGMGAAKPTEFTESPQTPTGIKNATVDRERAQRGLPPAMQPARREWGEVWDHAMALVDRDPGTTDRLLDELRTRPRALTDTEDALLLQRQIDLQNDYGKATRELAQAWADSKNYPNRAEDAAEWKLRVAELSDKLQDLYDIGKRAGTETGRGLAARKMMAYEDFSLAKMETEYRAAKGGAPLTDAERQKMTELQQRVEETQKALDAHMAKAADELAKRRVQDEVDARIKQVAQGAGYDRQVQSLADRIVKALETEADKARARLKNKFARTSAGVDPTILTDLSIVGAAHIARGLLDFSRWSKAMVEELGEDVVPWLNQAWTKSNERVNTAVERLAKGKQSIEVRKRVRKEDTTGQREQIVEGLKEIAPKPEPKPEPATTPKTAPEQGRSTPSTPAVAIVPELPEGDDARLGDYIRKLAENFIRSGVREREALIDAVHGVLRDEVGLDFTRRETMDAISGYGRFKALNPDEIKATLRDLKGQMQQLAKLEDIQNREPLQKTGVQRREVGDEERRLIQQVNEAKRRFGVVVTDPAKQLKSALDAVRTRLKNQIADIEYQMRTQQRIVKTKTPSPWDADTKLLEAQRDALRDQLDKLLPRPDITDAQRLQLATNGVERQIRILEKRIENKDWTGAPKRTPVSSPELEALKARREQLQAELQTLADAADPGRANRAALSALKNRLAENTARWRERLARGDFAPHARRSIQLDAEASRLKAANIAARQAWQRELITRRLADRPAWQRGMDTFVKWRRGFLLSSPVTLGKLTAAALQRLAITPIEEGLGAVYSRVLPQLAARAPREGGASVAAEARAITAAFTKGLADAGQILKTGKGEKDFLYGGRKDNALAEHDVAPRSVIEFVGNIHGALKAPVKAAEFTRSFEKRVAWNMRQGVDVTDPLVQTRIALEAYADAQRSIFLQDNRIVEAYKRALSAFEGKQPTVLGKLTATTARTLLPIVRVPTNLVAETLQYALGLPSGLARLGLALRPGLEKLPPAEADMILRHLKKGSLGAAMLTAGYFMPQVIGGYYQPGEKRPAGDVKAGALRVGGWNVPSWALHNPLLETLQIGATVRRVADSKLRKKDGSPQGVSAGLMGAALGMSEDVPFVREQLDVAKLYDPHTRGQFAGELTKSIAVPQLVQWLAQVRDTDAAGNPISRKPGTILQHVETGIPGLRETVPAKK